MADVDSSFNEAHAVAEPGDDEGHVRGVGGQRGVVQLGGAIQQERYLLNFCPNSKTTFAALG